MHDDAKVQTVLIELAKAATLQSVLKTAIGWIGRCEETPESTSFLLGVAGDASSEMEVRQQAVRALGSFKDPALLGFLTAVFAREQDRQFRRATLGAIAVNKDKKGSATFLLGVASGDGDAAQKRDAMIQLSRVAIRRESGRTERIDSETDVQREAVLAISRRDKEQAIPLLITIARTHPKDEVRRQAILSLGRIGDERAVAFFRENLIK